MAEWLACPTMDHKVLGSDRDGGGKSAHDSMVLLCTEPFIITLPSSGYDLNDVKRGVKHQTIIIQLFSSSVSIFKSSI